MAVKKNFFPDLEEEKGVALGIIDGNAVDPELEPYEEDEPATTSARYAPRPKHRRTETKSKRMQILIKPSLYEKLRRIAEAEGISINSLINEIIEGYQE